MICLYAFTWTVYVKQSVEGGRSSLLGVLRTCLVLRMTSPYNFRLDQHYVYCFNISWNYHSAFNLFPATWKHFLCALAGLIPFMCLEMRSCSVMGNAYGRPWIQNLPNNEVHCPNRLCFHLAYMCTWMTFPLILTTSIFCLGLGW